jgi:hypothetical protein
MKLTARRMLTTTALAGAAVLLPVVALASSAGTSAPKASTTAAAVHRCYRGDLTAWMGIPGNGTAGSTFYPLEISNVSSHSCWLYGFPGVSALKPGGGQLGSAAARSPGITPYLVTLAPFQTAHVDLQITDVGVFSPASCHPTTAVALKVYAPGDYAAIEFPFSFRACAKSGPVYMHVTPTLLNTGIPGYMNP